MSRAGEEGGQEFSSAHVNFEMSIRHPGGDVNGQLVMNLEFKRFRLEI